jgi:2-polyprenyl-6-methoxyphenol hydroxylase-like FAD-dependent oxidoreductase
MSWPSDEDAEALQGPAILADMKERASRYADPWKQAMLSMPDDTVCWHNRLTYWPTEPWDNRNGTVTLAGDAAHPMTFRTSSPS